MSNIQFIFKSVFLKTSFLKLTGVFAIFFLFFSINFFIFLFFYFSILYFFCFFCIYFSVPWPFSFSIVGKVQFSRPKNHLIFVRNSTIVFKVCQKLIIFLFFCFQPRWRPQSQQQWGNVFFSNSEIANNSLEIIIFFLEIFVYIR